MDILALLFLCLIVYQCKIKIRGFHTDYLCKEQTDSIKGIFIMFVFYRHFTSYIENWGVLDQRILLFNYYLDQLIVVMFLFYSGYGVAEAIRKKGQNYIKSMPLKRILPVWFRFGLAVMLFYILSFFVHKNYSVKRVLWSLIGWKSIGNSNWYIFGIILLYFITYIVARISKGNKHVLWIGCLIGSCGLIYFISLYKESYWYNTLIAYTLGLVYSAYKKQIEKVLQKEGVHFIALFVFYVIYSYSRRRSDTFIYYQIMVLAFGMFTVIFTMKIALRNRYLIYLGKHLFCLYILQRIPMIALQDTVIYSERYIYFISCVFLTLIMAHLFDKFTDASFYKGLYGKFVTKYGDNHTGTKLQNKI